MVTAHNDKRIRASWSVTRTADVGFPGDFERRLLRACEFSWSSLPRPLDQNAGLPAPNHRQLARLMGIAYGGSFISRVRAGFAKLGGLRLKSLFTFYVKSQRAFVKNTFSLFPRIEVAGQFNTSGKVAEQTVFYPCQYYLDNLNNRYVCPLDLNYLMALPPIASRLYEILSVKFYGCPDRQKQLTISYPSLCNLLPLSSVQPRAYSAKKILKDAHSILARSLFLAKIPPWNIQDPHDPDSWKLTYSPGDRYHHYKKTFENNLTAGSIVLPAPLFDASSPERVLSPTLDGKRPSASESGPQTAFKTPSSDLLSGKSAIDPSSNMSSRDDSQAVPVQAPLFQNTDMSSSDISPLLQDCLNIVQNIKNYPYHHQTDIDFFQDLISDFPDTDIIDRLKAWKAWLQDNRKILKKARRVNYRLRFRNWLKQQPKFSKQRKEAFSYGESDIGSSEAWGLEFRTECPNYESAPCTA